MENVEIVEIDGFEFKIPKWNMRKQLENQNSILPLIKDPMVNAVAMMGEEEDQSLFLAAMVKGVFESIQKADINNLEKVCLQGVIFRRKSGVADMVTVDKLEQEGLDISTFWQIILNVVKVNYRPFFNGGLQKIMQNMM